MQSLVLLPWGQRAPEVLQRGELCWEHKWLNSSASSRPRQWDLFCPQNYPLYIQSVPTENELKFHYTVHTSLDVVDEKISAMGKALVDQRELYLGLLYPTEDYKVYLCHTFVGLV